MKKYFLGLFILVFTACEDDGVQPDNAPNLSPLSVAETSVVNASNEFAFKLFQALRNDASENLFLSPLSVSYALAMTLNGASEETQKSILNTIHYGELSAEEVSEGHQSLTALLQTTDRTVDIGLANAVWFNNEYTVLPEFADTMEKYFSAKIQGLNFKDAASPSIINQWVESKTNGRIKDLVSSISPDDVMFIINTIYFKGEWTYQFDKSATRKAPFTLPDGAVSETDMMTAGGVRLLYHSNDQLQLIDIPYGNKQFRFTILMPHDPGYLETQTNLPDYVTIKQLLEEADSLTPELMLPKFRITWKQDLKGTLEQLGMKTVDFPKLFTEPLGLAISSVIHQSYLEVNEEGAEAAAATAVGISLTSVGSATPKIVVDKPFMFLIREEHSGAILFVGQLNDPTTLSQ